MADLNDLTKPDLQSAYANGDVPDTLLGHIKRLWVGDYTGMSNLVPHMLRWVITGTTQLSARLYRRNASGVEVEVTVLPGVSIGGNAATANFATNAANAANATNATNADTVSRPFTSGTTMLFAQTAAPTGWTKLTTHNNKALRVVSGTAGSGGSAAFTTAFGAPSVSGSVNVSGSIGSTTLTVAQMPAHRHNTTIDGLVGTNASYQAQAGRTTYSSVVGGYESYYARGVADSTEANASTSSTSGGNASHTHSFSGSASLSGAAASINVAYVDVIFARQD